MSMAINLRALMAAVKMTSFLIAVVGAINVRAETGYQPCPSSTKPIPKVKDVGTVGNLRDIATEKLNGRVDLKGLLGTGPLWALGMPHGLDRELLVEAGWVSTNRFVNLRRLEIRHPASSKIAFLVYARVPKWCSVALPSEVVDFAALEAFMGKVAARAGLDGEQALPFRLKARAKALRWFVVGGTGNRLPSPRASFERERLLGGMQDTGIEALGFYTRNGRGSLSNPNSSMHIHFRTTSGPAFVGHLDDEITIEPGAVVLFPAT